MTTPEHPIERLADLLDGRLSASEVVEIEQHVERCDACRRDLAWLRAGRALTRGLARPEAAPSDMRTGVLAALDEVDAEARPAAPAPAGRRLLWLGLAAAALVVLVVAPWRPGAPEPVEQAYAAFVAVRDDGQALERRTTDAATLERYFNEPARGPHIRVIDLAMMGWRLEGGSRRALGSAPSALYAYRSADHTDELVCQMYVGELSGLPAAQAIHRENGFEFHVYVRNGTTLVFWEEGPLVCVLAADLPTPDVLALAVAKAMAPS